MKRIALLLFVLCVYVLGTHATLVEAEDLKRWKIVTPSGEVLGIVEGLPSVYTSRVINYDPYGVTPNRCAAGCTFVLDSFQNVEGTTTTTTSTTTTSTTVVGGSTSSSTSTTSSSSTTTTTTATTTTNAPSSSGPFTGWTLRIAQLSQNQMQINGCLNNTGSSTPLTVTASWTVSKNGVSVGSGSGISSGLLLSSSSNPVCPTEFLANVSGLTASTEYVVTYSGGIAGNIVSGSRTIVTSNAPPTTTTTTTTTTVAPTTTNTTITSTTSPSPITVEPTTTSSSAPKSGNTDTTEVGSNDSSSASSTGNSSVSSAATTTTTAVPNGEVRASVGGVEVDSETTVTEGAVAVSVGEVTAEIANAEESEDSASTQAEQGLVLSSGESADVSIDGLQPNSEVEVVIYSTPRNLGSLEVNEFGELVASIQIPKDMESGPHTLVLSGLDKFGKQIELKFGLVVYSPDSYIPIWVWFLVGLLVISLAVSLVSQRSKKVVIAT